MILELSFVDDDKACLELLLKLSDIYYLLVYHIVYQNLYDQIKLTNIKFRMKCLEYELDIV